MASKGANLVRAHKRRIIIINNSHHAYIILESFAEIVLHSSSNLAENLGKKSSW